MGAARPLELFLMLQLPAVAEGSELQLEEDRRHTM